MKQFLKLSLIAWCKTWQAIPATKYRNGSDLWLDDKNSKLISYILTPCSWILITACLEAEQWSIKVKTPMCHTRNGYLPNEEKLRQSLSCSTRSFSDITAMKKSSADKPCWQNSFSQFRQTTKDWSHSCISPLTGMAPTYAYRTMY